MTATADVVYRWLGKAFTQPDTDHGDVLYAIVDAATAALAEVEEVTRGTEGRAGWQIGLDPENTPAALLPWLAQFAGVRYDARLSVGAMRDKISDRPYHRRGQVETIRSAAQRWLLSGDVEIIERDGDAWTFTVRYTDARVGAGLSYEALAAGSPTYADLAEDWKRYEDVNGNEAELQASVLAETPVGLNVVFDKVATPYAATYEETY